MSQKDSGCACYSGFPATIKCFLPNKSSTNTGRMEEIITERGESSQQEKCYKQDLKARCIRHAWELISVGTQLPSSVTQDKPGEWLVRIVDCMHSVSSVVADQSKQFIMCQPFYFDAFVLNNKGYIQDNAVKYTFQNFVIILSFALSLIHTYTYEILIQLFIS